MENIMLTNLETNDLILKTIKSKYPFSAIRCGDGEAAILGTSEGHIQYSEKRQLGRILSADERKIIVSDMQEAYSKADLVFVSPGNFGGKPRNEFWDNAVSLMNESLLPERSYSQCDWHTEALQSGFLSTLINSLSNINIISGRDLKDRFKVRYPNLQSINYYKLPPELLFESEAYKGKQHFPDIYNDLKKIKTVDLTGQTFLIGGGFLAKAYCGWIKQSNGIAIDLGSVFDHWAGLRTRGEGRGAGAKGSDEWKL